MKDYLEQILDSLAVSGGELGEQLGRLLLLEVHGGVEHHVVGIQKDACCHSPSSCSPSWSSS